MIKYIAKIHCCSIHPRPAFLARMLNIEWIYFSFTLKISMILLDKCVALRMVACSLEVKYNDKSLCDHHTMMQHSNLCVMSYISWKIQIATYRYVQICLFSCSNLLLRYNKYYFSGVHDGCVVKCKIFVHFTIWI